MRSSAIALAACIAAGQPARAQMGMDVTLSTIGLVMVAKSPCGYDIDWSRFERAVNYNGLYASDIQRHGRYFNALQQRAEATLRSITKNQQAGCAEIFRTLDRSGSIWVGVLRRP